MKWFRNHHLFEHVSECAGSASWRKATSISLIEDDFNIKTVWKWSCFSTTESIVSGKILYLARQCKSNEMPVVVRKVRRFQRVRNIKDKWIVPFFLNLDRIHRLFSLIELNSHFLTTTRGVALKYRFSTLESVWYGSYKFLANSKI